MNSNRFADGNFFVFIGRDSPNALLLDCLFEECEQAVERLVEHWLRTGEVHPDESFSGGSVVGACIQIDLGLLGEHVLKLLHVATQFLAQA